MYFMVYFLTFSPSSPHDFIKCGPTVHLSINPFLWFWKVWMILWWYKHDCDLWWCFIRSSLHFSSASAGIWVFLSLVFLCLSICLYNICPVHEFINGHVTFKHQWASNIKCHISRLDTQFVRFGLLSLLVQRVCVSTSCTGRNKRSDLASIMHVLFPHNHMAAQWNVLRSHMNIRSFSRLKAFWLYLVHKQLWVI